MTRSQSSSLWSLLFVLILTLGCGVQRSDRQPASSASQAASMPTATALRSAAQASPTIDETRPTDSPTNTPTFTPQPTNTPAPTVPPTLATGNTYRVAYVVEDDVLNVRSGPDVDFDIVGTIPPDATGIQSIAPATDIPWLEIDWQGRSGWVHRLFLTEVVTSETFCNDPAARRVVDNFRRALEADDGPGLTRLIHPQRGLLVRINWWNNEVHFNQQDISSLFAATDEYDWGYEDGSGEPIEGSFSEIIVPLLSQDFAGEPQIHCNDLVTGSSAGLIQLPYEYNSINYYTVFRPAPDNELDWGTWVLGIEYWGGQPYLSFLVHYQWEI